MSDRKPMTPRVASLNREDPPKFEFTIPLVDDSEVLLHELLDLWARQWQWELTRYPRVQYKLNEAEGQCKHIGNAIQLIAKNRKF